MDGLPIEHNIVRLSQSDDSNLAADINIKKRLVSAIKVILTRRALWFSWGLAPSSKFEEYTGYVNTIVVFLWFEVKQVSPWALNFNRHNKSILQEKKRVLRAMLYADSHVSDAV